MNVVSRTLQALIGWSTWVRPPANAVPAFSAAMFPAAAPPLSRHRNPKGRRGARTPRNRFHKFARPRRHA
jgi:hypothetical protein